MNKHFDKNEIKAGIGIDYGKMLVTKGGVIKKGFENTNYKSLVWLGRPANIASKLTDLANKTIENNVVENSFYLKRSQSPFGYNHSNISINEFFDKELFLRQDWMKNTSAPAYPLPSFHTRNLPLIFYYLQKKSETISDSFTTSAILMTETVYSGVKREAADLTPVKEGWIKEQKELGVPGYSGKVYGEGSTYTAFN